MKYLLDSGILLRLIHQRDPVHDIVKNCINRLVASKETLLATTQNVAESWNVATRPVSNNGFGFEPTLTAQYLDRVIEPVCEILPERDDHYSVLKRLLGTYQVQGKQVHDARLVASMLTWRIERILTLNPKHFQRFVAEGIEVLTPEAVNGAAGPS